MGISLLLRYAIDIYTKITYNILMGTYMYEIKINREPQIVRYEEERKIESCLLQLSDLQFVGSDKFDIECDSDKNVYTVTVYRERLETEDECSRRVLSEERYNEYRKSRS